jgi:hypothetical protein
LITERQGEREIGMMDFPRVIAEIISSYVGDWSIETIIINSECKQVIDSVVSENSQYMLINYILPNQIIYIYNYAFVKRLSMDNSVKITLLPISNNGEFAIVKHESAGKVILIKYDNECNIILESELPLHTKISHFTNKYFVFNNRLQYLTNTTEISGSIIIPNYQIIALNNEYIIFKSHDGDYLIIYSLSLAQKTGAIKFGAHRFPTMIKIIDRYLITITDFNELKVFDRDIQFSNILIENISIPIKITILEMIDNQIIFGNANKGLYGMYLNNIKNINKLSINNLFTGLHIANKKMYMIGPGASVVENGTSKNLRVFRELTNDKPIGQLQTILC